MTLSRREIGRGRGASGAGWPGALALAGWGLVIGGGHELFLPGFCGPADYPSFDWWRLEWLLLLNPPLGLAMAWGVMLLAMMPPLLPAGEGRPAFLAGYLLVWLPAGVPLMLAGLVLHVVFGALAVAAALGLAFAWQVAPFRRACLARCRRQGGPAFGRGGAFGLSCFGTCWALMLVPLVAGPAHLPAMAAVALLLAVERRWPA